MRHLMMAFALLILGAAGCAEDDGGGASIGDAPGGDMSGSDAPGGEVSGGRCVGLQGQYECHEDHHCPRGAFCSGRQCEEVFTPDCSEDSDCDEIRGVDLACFRGRCIFPECDEDTPCAGGLSCIQNVCHSDQACDGSDSACLATGGDGWTCTVSADRCASPKPPQAPLSAGESPCYFDADCESGCCGEGSVCIAP